VEEFSALMAKICDVIDDFCPDIPKNTKARKAGFLR
jgi:hypothetical protein